jgi:hypothetical protein
VEDHHVDRPGVEAQQCVQLTGTNRSLDLIALVANARAARLGGRQKTENGIQTFRIPHSVFRIPKPSFASAGKRTTEREKTAFRPLAFCSPSSDIRPLPAWWLLQGDQTRSHPELGRQTPQRQWYFVSRRGRVGRRQACKERIFGTNRPTREPRRPRQTHRARHATPGSNPSSQPVLPPLHHPYLPRGGAAR